ncbi:MAG: amidohydrolase family protein [Opitutaceae bacterium]
MSRSLQIQTGIIDCHTHCYPAEIVADPRGWAEANNELHWAELVAPIGKVSIQDWSTPESMLSEMDANGVEKAVLLGWYWEHESTCRWHCEAIAKWVNHAPDRLIGFASIYPNENVIDQLEAAKALGLSGVGELHSGVQQFVGKSSAWDAMADWCIENSWAINLHATKAEGADHPSSVATPLEDFISKAEAHPDLKMILAHWGGGLALMESNPKLRKILKNVYYDTAASPLLYDSSIFRSVVEAVGIEKVLYGSDYPLRVYPRKQKRAQMHPFLNAIQTETGLSEAELKSILRDNFERISK